MERLQYHTPQERERWLEELYAPLAGRDPDAVSDEVVEQEMSMFYSLKRQTEGGGA